MRARSPVAGVGGASCALTPKGALGRQLADERQVALEVAAGHARRSEDAEAAGARDGGRELGRARAIGHAGEQDRHADAEQVAQRRVQPAAHSSLDPAQMLMPLSVA